MKIKKRSEKEIIKRLNYHYYYNDDKFRKKRWVINKIITRIQDHPPKFPHFSKWLSKQPSNKKFDYSPDGCIVSKFFNETCRCGGKHIIGQFGHVVAVLGKDDCVYVLTSKELIYFYKASKLKDTYTIADVKTYLQERK